MGRGGGKPSNLQGIRVRSGRLSQLLKQQAGQCALAWNAGAAPKVKVNTHNVDFLSWYFPPVRGFLLFKAEILLLLVNQFQWAISSLFPPTLSGI